MMKSTMLSIFSLVACVALTLADDDEPLKAIAKLAGPSEVHGNITFTQQRNGEVLVEGIIIGLPGGQYGFHVHEKGDITGDCFSTGGHFNPDKVHHGAPDDEVRHVGDLGNIEFDADRIARVSITDNIISLTGRNSIIGRAVVVHDGKDDLGRGTGPNSLKTGDAGGRPACGVIGIL